MLSLELQNSVQGLLRAREVLLLDLPLRSLRRADRKP